MPLCEDHSMHTDMPVMNVSTPSSHRAILLHSVVLGDRALYSACMWNILYWCYVAIVQLDIQSCSRTVLVMRLVTIASSGNSFAYYSSP